MLRPTKIDAKLYGSLIKSAKILIYIYIYIYFFFPVFVHWNSKKVYGNAKLIIDIDNWYIDKELSQREKHWQHKLFTTTHDMNSLTDLFCHKGQG